MLLVGMLLQIASQAAPAKELSPRFTRGDSFQHNDQTQNGAARRRKCWLSSYTRVTANGA
jgi:hypothetical protein